MERTPFVEHFGSIKFNFIKEKTLLSYACVAAWELYK